MSYAMPSLTRVPAAEKGITIGDFLVPVTVGERISPRLRHAILVVAGALFIVLTTQVQILLPFTPVPITGQTFGVLLVGGALGFRRGTLAALLYLALGIAGLPVYAERASGIDTFAAPTGGYLVGFVLASAVVGRLAELGWDRRIVGALGALLIGDAIVFGIGLPWLGVVLGTDVPTTLEYGLWPFLAGEVVKIAAAAGLFPVAWWIVGRRPGDR